MKQGISDGPNRSVAGRDGRNTYDDRQPRRLGYNETMKTLGNTEILVRYPVPKSCVYKLKGKLDALVLNYLKKYLVGSSKRAQDFVVYIRPLDCQDFRETLYMFYDLFNDKDFYTIQMHYIIPLGMYSKLTEVSLRCGLAINDVFTVVAYNVCRMKQAISYKRR